MRLLKLLPIMLAAGCVLGDATDDREFCIKVFAEGSSPPAECNGRAPGSSITPTVSVTVAQGASKLILLQTSLLDGAEGSATVTGTGQPGNGVTISTASNKVTIPGSLLITVRATASAPPAGYNVKWLVSDGNAEYEFVMSILVTE